MEIVNGFVMQNADKLDRVLEGTVGRSGNAEGGLKASHGEDVLEEQPELVLAHYDKLGGLIISEEGNYKVKTGSFWDFKKKAPRGEGKGDKFKYTPEVLYIFNVNGEKIELSDPKELASAMQTVDRVIEKKKVEFKAKKAKSKLSKDGNKEEVA